MNLRLQADADLNRFIVLGLRRMLNGVDFQVAADAFPDRTSDLHVLRIAARQGRVVVSHDEATMPLHFRTFLFESDSPGLIIIQQTTVALGVVIEELAVFCALAEPEEMKNRIFALPGMWQRSFQVRMKRALMNYLLTRAG